MSATGEREGRSTGRSERRAESCTSTTHESTARSATPDQHVPPHAACEPLPGEGTPDV